MLGWKEQKKKAEKSENGTWMVKSKDIGERREVLKDTETRVRQSQQNRIWASQAV